MKNRTNDFIFIIIVNQLAVYSNVNYIYHETFWKVAISDLSKYWSKELEPI